eukprot:Opistho-2@33934
MAESAPAEVAVEAGEGDRYGESSESEAVEGLSSDMHTPESSRMDRLTQSAPQQSKFSLQRQALLRQDTNLPSSDARAKERQKRSRALSVNDRPPVSLDGKTKPFFSPQLSRRPGTGNKTVETTQIKRIETADDDCEILNQYTLYNELGRGAFGLVRLAIDNNTGMRHAVKILSKKRLRRKGPVGRPGPGGADPLMDVRREIAILKKLDHPNIVKLVEVIDDQKEDNLYLVFELVEKGAIMEIKEVKTADPFPEDLARRYFVELVLGIEYLHFQRIIHRDIKPGNLLLSDDGIIKMTDFGVSHMCEGEDDSLTKTAGSPAFMAPETVSTAIGSYSGRSVDIWAMGITLYCFVFGRCPWVSANIIELYEKIRTEELPFPKTRAIDPRLKDLFHRMLDKDPHTRASIAEIKEHPWVTQDGANPVPTFEENCQGLIDVTDQEVEDAVKTITRLSTLILIKSMGRRRSLSLRRAKTPELQRPPSAGGDSVTEEVEPPVDAPTTAATTAPAAAPEPTPE